jgi:4-hydroxyacetophenone monooxygenase
MLCDDVRTAVGEAEVPALLMVLVHLTGDESWLSDPYRPTAGRGLADHVDGGLPAAREREVRDAAVEAIVAWSIGAPVRVDVPDFDLLQRMMTACVGEPVPPEYGLLLHEELADGTAPTATPPQVMADFTVAIIGAGVSGILSAIKLRSAGFDVVVFEKAAELGGTWLRNNYPGAGVDTPSYLYSLPWFPRDWSQHFAKRDEVLDYLRDVAAAYSIARQVRFSTEVLSATWSEPDGVWTVLVRDQHGREEARHFDAVISAVGLLSVPKSPALPGVDDFVANGGQLFHSADWPDGLALEGRRIAVIGTGASSMQIVPALAGIPRKITVFQRSPQWISPNANYFRPVSDAMHWLLDHVPYYYEWYRFRLAWVFNDKVWDSLQVDPTWEHPDRSLNATNDRHRAYFTSYLREQLAERPDLVEHVLPDYPPFGKRMLIDNGWFAALQRPDVQLVTNDVARLTADGVATTNGAEYKQDVVVLATGFDALNLLHPIVVRGRDGVTLREAWGVDDARAYLGITMPGFPNLFFMYGPNTNSGSGGSYMFLAECQSRYILDLLVKMRGARVHTVECKVRPFEDYNRRLDEAHARMVWTHPGMSTYYRNSQGRVVANSPWRFIDYWRMTRAADLGDYDVVPSPGQPAEAAGHS